MSPINRLNATPQVTVTTSYDRSQNVVVTNEVHRQAGSETEITTKTTTSALREITETRRELEARINALSQQLQQTNSKESEAKSQETATAKPADTGQGVILENAKRFASTLANAPGNQNGSLLNTFV